MQRKELRKPNGDVYFEIERRPDNSYIYMNWIGRQSLEGVVMGGNHILSMLREQPCRAVINSNLELVGPWEIAVPYLALKWAPAAFGLGLKYFAHLMAPGIFGQKSYELFAKSTEVPLVLFQFEEKTLAEQWIAAQEKVMS